MLDVLKSYWLYSNTYCAIECITTGGVSQFFGVKAKKRKGEYQAIEKFEFDTPGEISSFLSKNQHCHLIINTDQVLVKETELKERDADMIAEAFPGLSSKDFFIDIYKTATRCFIAVCRKEVVNTIIKDFELEKIAVLSTRLGFGTLQSLLPYFKDQEIHTNTYTLKTQGEHILSFVNEAATIMDYSIEDVDISSKHLLALSGLFNYGQVRSISGDMYRNNSLLTTLQHQKTFFRKGIYVAIGILAIILMINTLFFTKYYSRYQNLKATSVSTTAQKENYKKALEKVEQKEAMVTNILQSGTSKSSFYINRLVAEQPGSIQLSAIDYQPLERSIQLQKPILYTNDTIILKGNTHNKIEFNNWIAYLEQQDWITTVTVKHYAQVTTGTADFEILIKLKDDAAK